MRTQLLQALSTAITTATAITAQGFGVATQMPFDQGGNPLYLKNMKKLYVGDDRIEQTTLIPLVFGNEVWRNDTICNAYLAVDAKQKPSQTDAFISLILGTKTGTGITNFGVESDYTNDTQEDVLIYTFEFRMNTITY